MLSSEAEQVIDLFGELSDKQVNGLLGKELVVIASAKLTGW